MVKRKKSETGEISGENQIYVKILNKNQKNGEKPLHGGNIEKC